MTNNPCSVPLFASLLPCCKDGRCIHGHSECPPELREQARAYYRAHGIGQDGKGLDRIRGTAFEEPIAQILDAFPGTRLLGFGPEPEQKPKRGKRP